MNTARSLQIFTLTALVATVTSLTFMLVPADKPTNQVASTAAEQIPTVTIVAKRMSPAEKRAASVDDDMPRVTITAKRMTPSQKLAALIAEKIELAQARFLSQDA